MTVIATLFAFWFVCGVMSAGLLAGWHRIRFRAPIDPSWFALAILMGFPGLIATVGHILTDRGE